jgi:ABC-type transport system involved in multi-copper enzyme maturation permease subunit
MLVAAAALFLFVVFYIEFSRFRSISIISRQLFSMIGGLACIYAILGGPFATVDSLSREKREDTLGLLFLTDLHAYDIVLGKLLAASVDIALGLAATMPIMALPLMMGGVTLAQYLYLALGTFSVLLLSLTLGIFVSSLAMSGRVAFGVTVLLLSGLIFGPMMIGDLLRIGPGHRWAPFLYLICPAYTMEMCLDIPLRPPFWRFWLHLGGLCALSSALLSLACFVTFRAWREVPRRARSRFLSWLGSRSAAVQARWRHRMLDVRPLTWLEGCRPLQSRVLLAIALLTSAGWLLEHLRHPRSWPDADTVILWPLFSHFALCLWIALDAPRRFADDKQSGALELLLCTPYRPERIVSDGLQALHRRFLPPLTIIIVLAVYSVLAHTLVRGLSWPRNQLFHLAFAGAIVIPVQVYGFLCVGLYQGLVSKNSLRATFMLVWKLFAIPWLLFFLWIFVVEVLRIRPLGFGASASSVYLMWAAFHVIPIVLFVFQARLNMAMRFRYLAVTR